LPLSYTCLMIRIITLSFLIVFLFSNCQKQKPEMKISYKVTESSVDSPSFNITYTSDKSGTSTQANSSSDYWSSGGIILNDGQFISMTVDCSAPHYDFVVTIYKDGNIWQSQELHNPTGTITLSGKP
jgi:hypothetical protein